MRDYAAAGLKESIPLLGSGFMTEGNLDALGGAGEGVLTTLHYAETLESKENQSFVSAYQEAYGEMPDAYAVHGYDTGAMLIHALDAVGGDTTNRETLIEALAAVELQSPRGPLRFSESHHPIQNIYLREIRDGRHEVLSVAHELLESPDADCHM